MSDQGVSPDTFSAIGPVTRGIAQLAGADPGPTQVRGFEGRELREARALLADPSAQVSDAELRRALNTIRKHDALAGPQGRIDAQLALEAKQEHDDLIAFLAPGSPQALSLEGLLGTLAQLLLQPTRVPGEPCLAPAPLLRDLLDLALGRLGGGLDAIFGKVGATVEDLLLPGFAAAEDLAHFVQAVLDDPITAALNLVLGQRNQIDCVVEGGLGVAESVFQTGVRHLEEKIAGGLG